MKHKQPQHNLARKGATTLEISENDLSINKATIELKKIVRNDASKMKKKE